MYGLKKYCYPVFLLVLAVTVCAVWWLGDHGEADTQIKQPSASPVPLLQIASQPESAAAAVTHGDELVGLWVPYMSLSIENRNQEAFKENFIKIADSAAEKGINALFVHVRPFCDALYRSEYYPWSHILTGEQGRSPGFDPLEFMLEYTHAKGMEFHAWLNPLRVKTAETPAELSDDNPYNILYNDHPYYFMEYAGGIYLDPAYPYVRSLIADGAAEIAERYAVDGIHFDDYFYPTQDVEPDREAYALYIEAVQEPLPLIEWRRANISAMVQEVYEKIKTAAPGVQFGISPQGNIENDENMGADVKAWCAVPGYVDYICPQLYYSFENPALGYGEALEQWLSLTKHENIKMYIGLALYKAGSDSDSGTWQLSDDIISRQIAAARAENCAGVVLYSSAYIDTEQTAREVANAVALLSSSTPG